MIDLFIYLFIAIIFFAGSGALFYYYYHNRNNEWNFRTEGHRKNYDEGSYKGFWHNNKYRVAIFGAYTLLILGASFLIIAVNIGFSF